MSNQQPSGVWQTAGRQRQSQSSSRTPQNRSSNASPTQMSTPSHPPRQDGGRPLQTNNAWTQRSSSAGGTNGQPEATPQEEAAQGVNGFNAAEVKTFLGRDAGVEVYKPAEIAGAPKTGSAWGSKPNFMANNQPFFSQLAKQIATVEGGG